MCIHSPYVLQILVHAPQPATEALIESCANIRAMTKEIFAPSQGETVQIGQHTNSFSISLSDELLASIKMSRVRGFHGLLCLSTDLLCDSSRTTKSDTCPAASRASRRRLYPS